MIIRSVHNRLEVIQDDNRNFLNVDQVLELTDHALIKIGGKPICIISKGD